MTRYLLDVASYQGDLLPSDVQRAGFTAVNLKISHGIGQTSVHPKVAWWVSECRRLGLGISTFHYFTADATGLAQAGYAYARMLENGLTEGTVHQLDVESSASLAEVRAYLEQMKRLLGRPAILYTGDWYWAVKGWNVSDLTPYLWAAPNDGYPGTYPGDTSAQWTAGYGGWPNLAVMQYAVDVLRFPDGTAGTIRVSKSAVRDETIWQTLTGGGGMPILIPALVKLREEFNALAPGRDKGSDGWIGDTAHQATSSDHNPDETGTVPIRDADIVDEVHAIDVDQSGAWPDGLTMEKIVQFLLGRCRAGAETRLRYIIFNKRIWSASSSWVQQAYTGASPHTEHAHFSASYTTSLEASTASWHLEDLMALSAEDKTWIDTQLKKYVGDVVPRFDAAGASVPATDSNPTMTVASALGYIARDASLGRKLTTGVTINDAFNTLLARTAYAQSIQVPAIAAAISAIVPQDVDEDALAEAIASKLGDTVSTDELKAAIVDAARELFAK